MFINKKTAELRNTTVRDTKMFVKSYKSLSLSAKNRAVSFKRRDFSQRFFQANPNHLFCKDFKWRQYVTQRVHKNCFNLIFIQKFAVQRYYIFFNSETFFTIFLTNGRKSVTMAPYFCAITTYSEPCMEDVFLLYTMLYFFIGKTSKSQICRFVAFKKNINFFIINHFSFFSYFSRL